MIYFYIGQIKGAKLVSRQDKQTKQTTVNNEVIVQFEDYDNNGDLVLQTQSIQFDPDTLQEFKDNLNKFVSIPHLFIQGKNGTWIFPDDSMKIQFYDINPLIPQVVKK